MVLTSTTLTPRELSTSSAPVLRRRFPSKELSNLLQDPPEERKLEMGIKIGERKRRSENSPTDWKDRRMLRTWK